MRPERWSQVRELFERAVDLPLRARVRYLDESTGDDAELRAEVERLLSASSDTRTFLEPPGRERVLHSLSVEDPDLAAGTRLGSYRVVRRIGSGGMGTVYEAVQERPERTVALKVLRDSLRGDDARRRFLVEAEVLGRLRHPGVAAIYEMGEQRLADGREVPFFALEYVAGARDLPTHAREQALSTEQRIELFREVCAAVQHAHLAGVLHRDLKPDNLLVGSEGRVKVIDYGVARAVDQAAAPSGLESRGEHLVGTLQYMAPEQLARSAEALDARADVYALGLVLFELLSDRRPYELGGRPLGEVVRTVCEQDVAAPGLARELDWIVLRALARERSERYESAAELSRDLGRYLAGLPVLAAPPSAFYRARKFVSRNRLAVGTGALVFASLTAGVAITTRSVLRLEQETARKQDALNELESASARTLLALERQQNVSAALRDMLGSVAPSEDGYQVTLFSLLERRRPSFEAVSDPLSRAELYEIFGFGYDSLGLSRRADELYHLALEALEQADEPAPELGVRLLTQLAHQRAEEVQMDAAADLLSRAATLAEQIESPAQRTAAVARVESVRATAAVSRGDHEEAVRISSAALESLAPELAEEDSVLLYLRLDQGRALLRLGRLEQAHTVLSELWERWDRLEQLDDPLAIQTGSELAQVLGALGRSNEALELQLRVVEASARVFGEHNITHLHTLGTLQITYLGARRPDLAEPIGARALRALESEHFTDRDLEISLRSNHASALGMLGRGLEAADELERVVALLDELGPEGDERRFVVLWNLAEARWVTEEFDDSELNYELMRDAAVKAHGSDSWQVHFADARLGTLLAFTGRVEEGLELLRAAYPRVLASGSELAVQRAGEIARSVTAVAARAGDLGEPETRTLLLELLDSWGATPDSLR